MPAREIARPARRRFAPGGKVRLFALLAALLSLPPFRPLPAQTHVMDGPLDPLAPVPWEQAFAEGPFQKAQNHRTPASNAPQGGVGVPPAGRPSTSAPQGGVGVPPAGCPSSNAPASNAPQGGVGVPPAGRPGPSAPASNAPQGGVGVPPAGRPSSNAPASNTPTNPPPSTTPPASSSPNSQAFPTTTDPRGRAAAADGFASLFAWDDREAERDFRTVIIAEPSAPTGYLGMALANHAWPGKAAMFLREATRRIGNAGNPNTGNPSNSNAGSADSEAQLTQIFAGYYADPLTAMSDRLPTLQSSLSSLAAAHPADADLLALSILWKWRPIVTPPAGALTDRLDPPAALKLTAAQANALRADLDRLKALTPEHPAKICRLWLGSSDWENDAAFLQQMPLSASVWMTVSDALASAGHAESAVRWLDGALRIAGRYPSDHPDWRFHEQLRSRRLHRLADAGRLKAIEADPDAPLTDRCRALVRLEAWDALAALPAPHPKAPLIDRATFLHAQALAAFAHDNAAEAYRLSAEFGKVSASGRRAAFPATPAVRAQLTEMDGELKLWQELAGKIVPAEALAQLTRWRTVPALQRSRLAARIGDAKEALRWAEIAAADHPGALPEAANLYFCQRAAGIAAEASGLEHAAALVDPSLPLKMKLETAGVAVIPGSATPVFPPPDLAASGEPLPPAETSTPAWTLPDAIGAPHALSSFHTKPTVFLFFLGRECRHCMEQLNTFGPLNGYFAKAGAQIVAVSTDDIRGVGETFAGSPAARQPFPFPILADPQLSAFKAWGVFDEFNDAPIHGVFLLDSLGKLRWRHLGLEPFMMAAEVLAEVERLR